MRTDGRDFQQGEPRPLSAARSGSAFRNDVKDYIGLEETLPGVFGGNPDCPFLQVPPAWVPGGYYVPACYQYVNMAEVRIEGFEFEGVYDAGRFFTGANVTLL